MSDVQPRFKETVDCPCGCGVHGTLAKGTGHVRNCPNSCPKCRGKRSRLMGRDKQRVARRGLGVPDARTSAGTAHEEWWRYALRAEVKSGQQVLSMAARYLAAEKQSDQSKAIGDTRPFAFVAMPKGWGSDGLVVVRLSTWRRHIAPLIEENHGVA